MAQALRPESQRTEESDFIGEALVVCERRWGTVLAIAVAVVVLVFVAAVQRPPSYRASATLLVGEQGPRSSVISQLASMSSAPAAATEMALMRSRLIASQIVAAPADYDPREADLRAHPRHLALTTLVDDASLMPLATLRGRLTGATRSSGQVSAWVTARAPGAPARVTLEFLDQDRVRISPTGWLAGFGLTGPAAQEFDITHGTELDYRGLRLLLHTSGDLQGRRFLLRSCAAREITDVLMSRLEVAERERNSGIVRVTFEDRDPHRAARIANAICDNYLALNVTRSRRSADLEADFIEQQLAEQERELARLEQRVADQKSRSPESIDLDSTARAIIDQLSRLEVEQVQGALRRTTLIEALALLEEGSFESLSSALPELDDPVTLGYLTTITRLIAEAEGQGRSDTGPFKLLLQTQLADLRRRAEELTLEHDALAEIAHALQAGDESALARLSGTPEGASPITASYLLELASLNSELQTLQEEYTEQHPELVQKTRHRDALREQIGLQLASRVTGLTETQAQMDALVAIYREQLEAQTGAELAQIWRAVENLAERTTAHIRARLTSIEAHATALAEQLAIGEQRLARLPGLERELAQLLRELAAHNSTVEMLLRSRQEAGLTRASTLARAEIIDYAQPPLARHSPRVLLTLGLATALGLLLGFGATLVHERWRGRLASVAELEARSGLAVLGVVPRFSHRLARRARRARNARHWAFCALRDDPGGSVAEAFRSLRANLRFDLCGRRPLRTLAITSSGPGEGKTTASIDLALACAASGQRVLLIDTALGERVHQRRLRLHRGPGLAEALEGGLHWKATVQRLQRLGLDVLPAGRAVSAPARLLASPRFGTLLDEAAADYDLVVVDVPSARTLSHLQDLTRRLDAVLLLYRAEGLPARAFTAAARTLRQAGVPLIGCVLNAARSSRLGPGAYDCPADSVAHGHERAGERPTSPSRAA